MKDLKPFQIAAIYGSIFFAVVGLIAFGFAGPKPSDTGVIGPKVIVWGTFPQKSFNVAVSGIATQNEGLKPKNQLPLNVAYQQKNPETFESDLLQSIASGESPDVVLLPTEMVLQNQKLLRVIPFTSYPERTYKDTFIDEGNLFYDHNGYFAMPFAVDPMVMFYNKTILTQGNIIDPPRYWDEVISMVPRLTETEGNLKIIRSTIALGEFRNITNAKNIFSLLLLQSGTPIITATYDDVSEKTKLRSRLDIERTGSAAMKPGLAALDFFTQFADPSKSATYTWNRSLPNSKDYFLAGNLAIYLGLGSEGYEIESQNPNLDFDMAFVPQERSTGIKSTFGNMYGLAILKASKNSTGSFQAITSLTSKKFLTELTRSSKLPPVRRDLLSSPPASDAYAPILYESALKSKGWLDVNSAGTETIFTKMIEDVLSGRSLPNDALKRADNELEVLLDTEELD